MNKKVQLILSILLNLSIVFLTFFSIGTYFFPGNRTDIPAGTVCLRYFTIDSNILSALASLILAVATVFLLFGKRKKLPDWIGVLKFSGTAAVTLTMLVVIFFLGPTGAIHNGASGYFRLFMRENFVLHFSGPVIALISYLVFDPVGKPKRSSLFFGFLPTVLYSIVYVTMVVFTKKWIDFYGFTFGGKMFAVPLSLIAVYLVSLLISLTLRKLKRSE